MATLLKSVLAVVNGPLAILKENLISIATMPLSRRRGRSLIHEAALEGNIEVVELVMKLKSGDDMKTLLNMKDEQGKTVLHLAVEGGKAEIVSLLLKYDVLIDTNCIDSNGFVTFIEGTKEGLYQNAQVGGFLSREENSLEVYLNGNTSVVDNCVLIGLPVDLTLKTCGIKSVYMFEVKVSKQLLPFNKANLKSKLCLGWAPLAFASSGSKASLFNSVGWSMKDSIGLMCSTVEVFSNGEAVPLIKLSENTISKEFPSASDLVKSGSIVFGNDYKAPFFCTSVVTGTLKVKKGHFERDRKYRFESTIEESRDKDDFVLELISDVSPVTYGTAIDLTEKKVYFAVNGDWKEAVIPPGCNIFDVLTTGCFPVISCEYSMASLTYNWGQKRFKYPLKKGDVRVKPVFVRCVGDSPFMTAVRASNAAIVQSLLVDPKAALTCIQVCASAV